MKLLLPLILALVLLVSCKTTKTSQSLSTQSNVIKADTIIKRDSSSKYVRIDSTIKMPESIHDAFIKGLPTIPDGLQVVIKNDSLVTITVTKTDTVYRIRTIVKERLGKVVKIVSIQSNSVVDTTKRFRENSLSVLKETRSVNKPRWILNWWWLILAIAIGGYLVYKMRGIL